MRRRSRATALTICLTFACAAAACGKSDAKGAPGSGAPGAAKVPLAFPVEVTTVALRDVEFNVTAIGTVQAFEEIQVTARVAGAVEAVNFVEGDVVTGDQVLIEIEPRRYSLAVQQARATLQRGQAGGSDARKGLKRREQMGSEVAAGEEIDTFRTKVSTSEAEIALAKAALALAELNLRDARVRASAAGIIQTRKVSTGQYVQPGTVLATLVQRDPLRLRFNVAEADAQRVRVGQMARFTVTGWQQTFEAKVTHVAMTADETSRLVPCLATIEQPPAALKPGAFAVVEVPVGLPTPAPVIPQTAVRPSEKGFLAYTVDGNKAKEHVLTLGMRTKDGQVEVRAGVLPGEQLVVRGAEALKNGSSVRIVSAKPRAGPRDAGANASAELPQAVTAGVPTAVAP